MGQNGRQVWHGAARDGEQAVDALVRISGLSRSAVKRALAAGSVWMQDRGRRVRLRRATKVLPAGAPLWLYYDADLLARKAPQARCLHREKGFSVWFKPAGLVTQGNQWGDHLSLMRQAEKALGRPVWLVHRLDYETPGLVVLAHHRQAAGWLSRQFQTGRVEKVYYAWAHGMLQGEGVIETALDGKPARTRWQALAHRDGCTLLRIHLETGRLHQIRRHLAGMGHAVVGDPKHGAGREDVPLQLLAQRLCFMPPGGHERACFEVDDALWAGSGVWPPPAVRVGQSG